MSTPKPPITDIQACYPVPIRTTKDKYGDDRCHLVTSGGPPSDEEISGWLVYDPNGKRAYYPDGSSREVVLES